MKSSKIANIAIAALFFAAAGASVAAPGANLPSVTVNGNYAGANSGEAYQGNVSFVSTKTRAEVQQELREAQKNGLIYAGEAYPGPFNAESVKTRAEVVADLKQYLASHPQLTEDGALPQAR